MESQNAPVDEGSHLWDVVHGAGLASVRVLRVGGESGAGLVVDAAHHVAQLHPALLQLLCLLLVLSFDLPEKHNADMFIHRQTFILKRIESDTDNYYDTDLLSVQASQVQTELLVAAKSPARSGRNVKAGVSNRNSCSWQEPRKTL